MQLRGRRSVFIRKHQIKSLATTASLLTPALLGLYIAGFLILPRTLIVTESLPPVEHDRQRYGKEDDRHRRRQL
jgi:hypothetical protein